MSDDFRNYIQFYGIKPEDWTTTWGGNTWEYFLVRDYISDAASCASYTTWADCTGELKFIYPHNIKKKYVLEGVCQGCITFYASTATSWVSYYRVTIMKRNEDTSEVVLATTGNVNVNRKLEYNSVWGVGEDIAFPFWIDAFESTNEISENDRIMCRIEWNATSGASAALMHDNDPQYDDLNIEMGFLM